MEHCLFPSIPNTAEVNDLKDFYWVVTTSRGPGSEKVSLRHCTSTEPFLELLAAPGAEPASPVWMADLLSWSERGEFMLALGRGLVVSLAVRGLRVRGEIDPADADRIARRHLSCTRTFHVEGPQGPALVRCEWDEPLDFESCPGGWHEAHVPDSDVPLMIYVQAADPGADAALTRKKLERFERVDLGGAVTHVQEYQNNLPMWRIEPESTGEAPRPDLEALWNFGLHLHRASTYSAETPFSFNWECPCRTSPPLRAVHGHRYALHVVWDWLLLNPDRARQEFANYVRSFDEDSGMMASCTRPSTPAPTPRHPESGPSREASGPQRKAFHSHPPLWPYVAWQLYLVLRDRNFLEEMLRIGLRNAAWWEENRRAGKDLFGYVQTASEPSTCALDECGCDGRSGVEGGPHVSAALSCQMTLFYLCLKRFAGQLGETALTRDLQARYDRLAERIRTGLWDDRTGCFSDRVKNKPVRAITSGTFFSLLAAFPNNDQVVRLCEHAASESGFFRYFPVPSVVDADASSRSSSVPAVSSIARTLWVVAALRSAARPHLAGQIARRALDAAAEVLARDGTIYDSYNPDSPDQLRSTTTPATRYHVGNAPLHALATLGLFGIEMTRDGLVVDPVGVALPNQSVIEVQLPERRLSVLVRRTDAADGIEVKVRAGRQLLSEGFGRTVIGLGKLL